MNIQVFDRIEKKYLLTKKDKRQLLACLKQHMQHDQYHKSEVYNLYFDNDNYDMITDSIDWVDFKKKLRARSYGGYDRVFLEIKTKLHGTDENLGYKRRVMITKEDFDQYLTHKCTLSELANRSIEASTDPQIAAEIDYLTTHFNIKPRILVIYHRESYRAGPDLRITFDENLRFRDQNLSFTKAKHDKIYFKDDRNIIMEVKARGALPLWLVHELSERKLYPQQFSKIGKVYESLRKESNV